MDTSFIQGTAVPKLGFGTMRLPTKEDGTIDEGRVDEMIDTAMQNGVNYFDTAYPYHGGMSEVVVGKSLSRYPRESFLLADKFPGHQIRDVYDPQGIFEDQLKKCGVEYFDFYLLHNVYEKSLPVYTDEKWGIIDYFCEQKRLGRIKHLGFSSHADIFCLKEIVERFPGLFDFCQIQFNYLDYTLQKAKDKYEYLTQKGIPVIVMEPIRGGRLAKITDEEKAEINAIRKGMQPAEAALSFIRRFDNVAITLSGMSALEQMKENIKTFDEGVMLNDEETEKILSLAEKMKKSLPCTSCRYCVSECPMGLDIPTLISCYNDIKFSKEGSMTAAMRLQSLAKDKLPSCCIGCGHCTSICPQKIEVPKALTELSSVMPTLLDWEKESKKREQMEIALREKLK